MKKGDVFGKDVEEDDNRSENQSGEEENESDNSNDGDDEDESEKSEVSDNESDGEGDEDNESNNGSNEDDNDDEPKDNKWKEYDSLEPEDEESIWKKIGDEAIQDLGDEFNAVEESLQAEGYSGKPLNLRHTEKC